MFGYGEVVPSCGHYDCNDLKISNCIHCDPQILPLSAQIIQLTGRFYFCCHAAPRRTECPRGMSCKQWRISKSTTQSSERWSWGRSPTSCQCAPSVDSVSRISRLDCLAVLGSSHHHGL